jgi:hypothetical protein
MMSWSQFKSVVDSKSISFQENDSQGQYVLTAIEGVKTYQCSILKTSPANADQSDYETNYQANKNGAIIIPTKNNPSDVPTSLRIKGDVVTCPANTTTNFKLPLDDAAYRIRGAELQIVNGKAGDWISLWVTDDAGALGQGPNFRYINYIPKFSVFEHSTSGTAPVIDIVDDDTSDALPQGVFSLDLDYHNNQPASSPDVQLIINFWLYVEGSS